MNFKTAFHSVTGHAIIEVYDNSGAFVAAIYPNEKSNGIKIVSKFIATFDFEDDKESVPPVPALTVDFLLGALK